MDGMPEESWAPESGELPLQEATMMALGTRALITNTEPRIHEWERVGLTEPITYYTGWDMPERPIVKIGDKVVVNQIKVATGEFVQRTQHFSCPIVARICKCMGTAIKFTIGGESWFYHPEYEVAIKHPIRVRGREVVQERFYMVLFEDMVIDSQYCNEIHKLTEDHKTIDYFIDPFDDGDFFL